MAKTSKTGLRFDDFIEKVRPDPKSSDALVLLQGYIGQSDLNDHVRIYFNPELSDFIELPEREICYAEPVKAAEDALGGSRLWVRKTAVFTTGDPAHANRAKSSFLEGDLLKAFGGQAGNFRAGVGSNIPSAFLEQGCVPRTEPFGVCNVQTNQDWCQVFEPPTHTRFTLQNPSCIQTCPQYPCTPPSGNLYAICRSVNNVTCENEVIHWKRAVAGIQFYTSKLHPLCGQPSAFVSCKVRCPEVQTRTCPRTINCREFISAACNGGGGIVADTLNYVGGFNPYGMGY